MKFYIFYLPCRESVGPIVGRLDQKLMLFAKDGLHVIPNLKISIRCFTSFQIQNLCSGFCGSQKRVNLTENHGIVPNLQIKTKRDQNYEMNIM